MSSLQLVLTGRARAIDQRLALLAPRWTTWALQTIHQRGSVRTAAIIEAMPWNRSEGTMRPLVRMHKDGLVVRPRRGMYELPPPEPRP